MKTNLFDREIKKIRRQPLSPNRRKRLSRPLSGVPAGGEGSGAGRKAAADGCHCSGSRKCSDSGCAACRRSIGDSDARTPRAGSGESYRSAAGTAGRSCGDGGSGTCGAQADRGRAGDASGSGGSGDVHPLSGRKSGRRACESSAQSFRRVSGGRRYRLVESGGDRTGSSRRNDRGRDSIRRRRKNNRTGVESEGWRNREGRTGDG